MVADGKDGAADQENTELPSYSEARNDPVPPPAPVSVFSSGALKTEHTFSLNNSKGKAWLSLVVKSRSPTAKTLPLFLDGDAIAGEVRVALDKTESAKAVSVSVSTKLVSLLLLHCRIEVFLDISIRMLNISFYA